MSEVKSTIKLENRNTNQILAAGGRNTFCFYFRLAENLAEEWFTQMHSLSASTNLRVIRSEEI